MKYTLTINQKQAIELGLSNVVEAVILQLIADAHSWAEPEIYDQKVYYWTARQKIVKELPLLKIKEDRVYRYLKSLSKLDLIDYIKIGKKDCVRLTKKGKGYYVDKNTEKEKNSVKIPKKLGISTEKNSVKIPTYKNTTLIRVTKDPLSSEKSKNREINFKKFREEVAALEDFGFSISDLNYSKEHPGFQIQKGYIFSLQNQKLVDKDEAFKIWAYLYEKKEDVFKLIDDFKIKRIAS